MQILLRLTSLLALSAAALPAQKVPPIRPLGPVSAAVSDTILRLAGLRHLPDGRVLVNDPGRRRVVMLDSTLKTVAVVADTTSATGNAYGARFAGLLAYRGDSTLFVDPQSLSMLVIDPAGKVARVMSVPRSDDASSLAGPIGGAYYDGRGGIVYRSNSFNRMMRGGPGGPRAGGPPPPMPDTAPVVRVDLATRKLDTLAWLKITNPAISVSRDESTGRLTVTRTVNPLPVVDEWAVTPDGAVAIVRGRDYHVDWVNPDGSRTSSPKLAFEWQRLTDEDKVAFMDSVKAQRERMAAQGLTAEGGQVMRAGREATAAGAPGAAEGAGGVPGERVSIVMAEGPPGGAGPPPATFSGAPQVNYVSPSELPDYKPPFFAGAVRADADGNLWIRTIPTKQIPGGPVYDVIDRQGQLVDRVQVPANRAIAGFGPGGVVYLTGRDGERTVLERARVR